MNKKHLRIPLALTLGLLTLVGVMALLWTMNGPVLADTTANAFYVAPSGSDVAGCGSQSAPCRTIQYAVDQASSGDEIRIAATDNNTRAIYTGSDENVIELRKSLTLRGGYAYMHLFGTTWMTGVFPSQVDGEHARRVLFVTGDITPSLEFLSFVNGQAERGGNVYAENAHLRFVATPILSGTATYGGGLYFKNCTVSFDIGDLDLTGYLEGVSGLIPVLYNTAQYGGGFYIENGNPIIAGTAVMYNEATADGGGFYVNGGKPVIVGGLVQENKAADRGGGFFLGNSPARIAALSVYSNVATTGAGFYLDGPFSFNPLNLPIIANNYVRHNHTNTGDGGAFYLHETIAGLVNNIIADNVIPTAGEGAAMYLYASSPQLLHNTIADNQGHTGIYVTEKPGQVWPPVSPLPSYPSFTNTIIVSHTTTALYVDTTDLPDPLENSVSLFGTLWYANGTDIGGDGDVSHSSDVYGDPRFVCTGDLPRCLRPYHILTDSAAVDAGVMLDLSSLSGSDLFVDIDFQLRPSGEGYDLGADEIVSDSYSVWIIPPVSLIRAEPGQIVTHSHKLMNTGLETDVYTLSLTTSAGWSQLIGETVITLSPQTSRTLEVRVNIPATATNRTRDTALITATSHSASDRPGAAVDVAEVVTDTGTDLQVSKWAAERSVTGGEPIHFTVVVTNAGPVSDTLVVTLTDTAVPTTAIGAWGLPAGCAADAARVVVCTRTLPGGHLPATAALHLLITTTDVYSGPLANLVQVSTAAVRDSDPLNDYSLATVRVTTTATTCVPVSEVTIYGPTGGYTGTAIPFTAMVNQDADRPITFTWWPRPQGSLLLPGTSVVTYTWALPGVKTLTVTAENCSGSLVTATHTITIYKQSTPLADLAVSKRADVTTTQGGGRVEYTIVLTKAGSVTPTLAVTLTDTVVPTTALSLLHWPANCTGTITAATFYCHWELPGAPMLVTRVFTVALTFTETFSGPVDNKVVVNGDVRDPDTDNNTAHAAVLVRQETSPRWNVYLPLVLRSE